MPGITVSSERVPIRPMTHGMRIAKRVVRAVTSGRPNTVNAAGAGSVSHIDSIEASFIFWCSVSV